MSHHHIPQNLNPDLHLSENLKLTLTYMYVSCSLTDQRPACHLLHVTFFHYKNNIKKHYEVQ